ncbi:MAG: hypothetical protein ACOYM0_01415 [Bacteroidales bacterium]
MVTVNEYKTFWNYLVTVVSGIDQVIIAHEDSDLAGMIRDIEAGKVLLMAIIPSSDVVANNIDNYEEIDSCYVFVIKKSDPANLTHDESLTEIGQMQQIMTLVKHKLIELSGDFDHCSNANIVLMHRLIISSIHTEPEYNLLGCNGYGLFFKLKTVGV